MLEVDTLTIFDVLLEIEVHRTAAIGLILVEVQALVAMYSQRCADDAFGETSAEDDKLELFVV